MVKLYGVVTTSGEQVFLNLEEIVSMKLTKTDVELELSTGLCVEVSGDYIHHLAQKLEVLELIPLGTAESTDHTDVNNTEYVDDTTDGLEEPIAVELRGYDESHDDGHPELEEEQFASKVA